MYVYKSMTSHLSKLSNSSVSRYVDVLFLLRFGLLMCVIYYFNVGYISIIDDRGMIYSRFFDQHLNYFSLLRGSILHTSDLIVQCFGLNSYVAGMYSLRLYNGPGVYVGLPCLGYGVMSFWIAFIVAHNTSWQKKLWWSIGGVIFLWLLNCWRVALILMAVNKHWDINKWMDNHTLFNRIVYGIIFLMIIAYYKISKPEKTIAA